MALGAGASSDEQGVCRYAAALAVRFPTIIRCTRAHPHPAPGYTNPGASVDGDAYPLPYWTPTPSFQ
ncbi:MAG: hypothetical protein ACRDTD_17355 [Pseudonocardiaceae bacterium]